MAFVSNDVAEYVRVRKHPDLGYKYIIEQRLIQ